MHRIRHKIKAFIFDLDGTIIQSNHHWEQATRQVLEARGHNNFNEEQNQILRDLCGVATPRASLIIKIAFNLQESVEEIIREKQHRVAKLFVQNQAPFIDGFERFHQLLQEHNIKHGIGTNANDETLEYVKQKVNLPHYFGEHIYNISHVNQRAKPDPALFLHVAEQLEVMPEECIVFEDSLQGFTAAKAANMRCIGINNASNAPYRHMIDGTIDSYDEAVTVLCNLLEKC